MYKLTTAEESDKRDELMTNITLCESLKNLVSDSGLDMDKIYECMFKDILHLDDIYDKVSNKGGNLK